jgi:uncharacterized protein (TIGR03905 family)
LNGTVESTSFIFLKSRKDGMLDPAIKGFSPSDLAAGGFLMHYSFRPRGICPSRIQFDIDGGIVSNISFEGGCEGNLKAIAKLLSGRTVEEISETCEGNTCGRRQTSCADQLALAVREALGGQTP